MGVTRVILTHVVQVGFGQGASYGNKDVLEDWLQSRAAPLHTAGIEVEIDIRAAGEVAKDILQAARDHGADLIVIGSRGQNMIRGLFPGSVAREVIRLSALPVRLEWIEATGKDGDAACAPLSCRVAAGASGHRLFAAIPIGRKGGHRACAAWRAYRRVACACAEWRQDLRALAPDGKGCAVVYRG